MLELRKSEVVYQRFKIAGFNFHLQAREEFLPQEIEELRARGFEYFLKKFPREVEK